MGNRGFKNKNGRLSDSVLSSLRKVAALYSITHDDWLLDRFLGMTRKGRASQKSIHGFLKYSASRMDDTHRFVYGQLLLQRRWLEFHGKAPCDKSKVGFIPEHVLNLFKNEPITKIIRAKVDFDSLAKVDQNPLGAIKSLKSPPTHDGGELRFRKYSGKPLLL